jgi:hypothetical protein
MDARNHFFIISCFVIFLALAAASKTSAGEIPKDRLSPPQILAPKDISEFRDTTRVEFKWRVVPNAKQYHVVIAKDRKFRKLMHQNMEVRDFYYLPSDLDYGTYFFRVSSVSADGTEGPFSDTISFVIVPPPPPVIPVK